MANKTAELRELPDDELFVRVEQAKEELFNLRFQLATGQLDDPSRVKGLRHEIARVLTVLRERHLEGELEEELARADADALERSREAQARGDLKGTPLGEMEREALDEGVEEGSEEQNEEEEEGS
ncbi:MAG: 50S ribosomal protein L29 [Actinobacteria bacterium]|nr:50S ribosomal protein L29 [Actinomycetota bacterium]